MLLYRYKVWPSAYASGYLVKCRKKKGRIKEDVFDIDEAVLDEEIELEVFDEINKVNLLKSIIQTCEKIAHTMPEGKIILGNVGNALADIRIEGLIDIIRQAIAVRDIGVLVSIAERNLPLVIHIARDRKLAARRASIGQNIVE